MSRRVKQVVTLLGSAVMAGAVTLGGVTSAVADDDAPAVPDNVRLVDLQANQVTIAWDAAAGAADYVVRLYGGSAWHVPSETVRTPDLTHTFFIFQGNDYEVTVTAYAPDGSFSEPSERFQFTAPVDPENPAVTVPTDLEAEASITEAGVDVAVTWSPSHSDAGGVRYTLLVEWPQEMIGTSVTAATFDAKPSRTYRLVVRAEDAAGRRSFSDPMHFTTPDVPLPSPPDDVQVATEPGTVTVTWDPPDSTFLIREYEVVLNGTVKRSTVTAGTSATFDYAPGGEFEATVQARDVENRWSDPSVPVAFTLEPHEDWSVPTTPANLRVTFDDDGGVDLVEWDASTGGVGSITYNLNIIRFDGSLQAFERTTELFVNLDPAFGFTECGPSDTPTEFNVTASSFGVHSPPSETIELCF